jgi:hypothetical protein
VAAGDLQPCLARQAGQARLPGPGPVAVGPAGIGGDQQPPRRRVVRPAAARPPAADGFHRERGGVVVGAHVHPAGAGGQVVDPVRDHLPVPPAGEIVIGGLHRVPGRPPGPPRAGILADLLLLLGIDADHRIPARLVRPGLLIDVPELAVPVRMLLPALQGLGIGLQAEPLGLQQLVHRLRGHLVPLAPQLGGQRPDRLDRPPQRRFRVPPLLGLHQGQQRRDQPRIGLRQLLAAPARPAGPAQRLLPALQLPGSGRHRGLADSRGSGHQPDPAMTQRPRLSTQQQPALPLIQMRQDRPELRRQHLPRHR